jgi:hypothetical protein
MATVQRGDVESPVLPQEAVPFPVLGGDVIVRGLLLSDQLALSARAMRRSQPEPGEAVGDAQIRARALVVAEHLASSVVLEDGKPLWTATDWEAFGAKAPEEAMRLYRIASRLSGDSQEAAEKN